jgi:hypothetical protein
VCLRDRASDRQPHPESVALGREERIEESLEIMRRRPETSVLHRDEDVGAGLALSTALARDPEPARACRHVRHRVDGVHDQVQDDLLQLDPISQYCSVGSVGRGLLDQDVTLGDLGLVSARACETAALARLASRITCRIASAASSIAGGMHSSRCTLAAAFAMIAVRGWFT